MLRFWTFVFFLVTAISSHSAVVAAELERVFWDKRLVIEGVLGCSLDETSLDEGPRLIVEYAEFRIGKNLVGAGLIGERCTEVLATLRKRRKDIVIEGPAALKLAHIGAQDTEACLIFDFNNGSLSARSRATVGCDVASDGRLRVVIADGLPRELIGKACVDVLFKARQKNPQIAPPFAAQLTQPLPGQGDEIEACLIFDFENGGLSTRTTTAVLGCDLVSQGDIQVLEVAFFDRSVVPDRSVPPGPILVGENCADARAKLLRNGLVQSGPSTSAKLRRTRPGGSEVGSEVLHFTIYSSP